MIKIYNKNGEILKEIDVDSLIRADLSGADLRRADLSGANLSGADLIIITWSHWTTYITKGHVRIGCQSHTLEEWREFSDDQISDMDPRSINFWKQNKELIISLCERFEDKEANK